MGNRTLTQEYALYAYKCIKKVKELNLQSDYKTRVRRLPAMITHNGLLTTLTFLYSKAKFKNEKNEKSKNHEKNKKDEKNKNIPNAEALLLKQIIFWLKSNKSNNKNNKDKRKEEDEIDKEEISSFIGELAEADFQHLVLYSRRALTLAQWLKRLAEGEFEDAKDE